MVECVMAECIIIDVAWPVSALSSNSRAHWAKVAEARSTARSEAWTLAIKAKVGKWPNAVLTFAYHPPDNRRRDVQNMPHMLKSAIDGIADAMGCDDNGFRPRFPDHFGATSKRGYVRIGVFNE